MLARALDSQPGAIEDLARRLEESNIDPAAVDRVHKIGPALCLLGNRSGIAPVHNAWRRSLHATAAWRTALDAETRRVATVLGEAGIPWAPIKGVDLGDRVVSQREARSTSDLDVLIFPADLARTRQALEAEGWQGLYSGTRYDRFLRDEGYCWQAHGPAKVLLEVHFRLWGIAPVGLGERVLNDAEPTPELGFTARRLRLGDAYVLAAVHTWMDPPPRPLRAWWDLDRIVSADPGVLAQAQRRATEFGLELPVALAAQAASSLWPIDEHVEFADRLTEALRPRERGLLDRMKSNGVDGISLGALSLTRMLAGRPSRHRARAILRRVWAHPGIVERETEDGLWPLRRVRHLLGRLQGR